VPLHIKIALSHHERARDGHKLQIELSDLKTVLVPRRRLLTQLDPEGRFEYNALQMRELIRQYAKEYKRVVIKGQIPANMDVKGAIKVYRNFKLLCSAPTWGPVPMSCTCRTCFGHCVCANTLLIVSFDPKVQVTSGYIGATVSDGKKCKLIGGMAGRRRMCIVNERNDDKKEVHSKALLLAEKSESLLRRSLHRCQLRALSCLKLSSRLLMKRTTISR
jgi:hypothetical protein